MPAKPIRLPEGIDDHRPLQKKIWAAQRVAWVLFALMLIACLFGAFGRGGYLSRAITQSAAGAIDFPLLTRWNAPENLEVTLSENLARGHKKHRLLPDHAVLGHDSLPCPVAASKGQPPATGIFADTFLHDASEKLSLHERPDTVLAHVERLRDEGGVEVKLLVPALLGALHEHLTCDCHDANSSRF